MCVCACVCVCVCVRNSSNIYFLIKYNFLLIIFYYVCTYVYPPTQLCVYGCVSLTTLTLFDHLDSLSCFQADFCIFLTLVVCRHHMYTHTLLCTQGFSTFSPWGWWKKTGREPAASTPATTWTAARHSPTATQPQPISTWNQINDSSKNKQEHWPKVAQICGVNVSTSKKAQEQ